MAKSLTAKTSSGKTAIVKAGSKAEAKYKAQGATFSNDPGALRTAKDASIARTKANNAADPITVAQNMGIDTPDRIEAAEMPGVVADLAKKGAVATPMAPAAAQVQSAATAPITPPTSATPNGVAPAPTPTQNRYQQALTALQGGGIPAPSDAGQAKSTLATAIPPAPEDTSSVDQFISEDPAINSLMGNIATLLNPQKQTTTLMQDYKKLYKESGLADINEELIDAETVINGTEDDLRNEIQTAGGLATDSQVQALALSRNKGLLKRYNQLVQMKTDATNQLNTLSNLNAQDKEIAQKRVDSQISAMFNMANFRQTAISHSREQYQWMASQMGADGLYNSLKNDPRQLANAEKILGTGPGGLQTLATTASADRARKIQMENLDIQSKQSSIATDAAQRANIYSQIEERKNVAATTLNGKPQTQAQAKAQGYADRLAEAAKKINQLGGKFTGGASYLGQVLPNFLKGGDRQVYEQAQRNFANAVLRQESGAVIADSEFDSAKRQYFPQPGDTQSVITEKAANRATTINNLYREGNVTHPDMVISPEGTEVILTD